MAETKSSKKPKERWLLTRKTWRYMADAGRKLVPEGSDPRDVNIEALSHRFQELCTEEDQFVLWDGPNAERKPYSWEKKEDPVKDPAGQTESETQCEAIKDECLPHTVATQTEEGEFFEIDRKKKARSSSQSIPEETITDQQPIVKQTQTQVPAPNQNFSSAVMKYFGMGRKKTDKDKIDRFKTINYDRNLRNIKSKNVHLDSVDTGNNSSKEPNKRDIEISVGIQVGESQVLGVTDSYKLSSSGSTPRRTVSPVKSETAWSGTRCSITVSDDMCDDEEFSYRYDADFAAGDADNYVFGHRMSADDVHCARQVKQIFFGENFAPYQVDSSVNHPRVTRQSLSAIQGQVKTTRSTSTISNLPASENSPSYQAKRRSSLRVSAGSRRKNSPLSHVASNLNLNHLISAVMHRSRSGSSLVLTTKENCPATSTPSTNRIASKILWKNRSKSQSRASASNTSTWTPQGFCKWTSITGRQVILNDTTLLHLNHTECLVLRKVALAKLQELDINISLRPSAPATSSAEQKPKRRAQLLRKRDSHSSSKSTSQGGTSGSSGLVFGIPLEQCVANERVASDQADDSQLIRKSYGSHVTLKIPEKVESGESAAWERNRSSESTEVLPEEPHNPRVPSVVSACLQHLRTYGLNTLGIFRVSSSKKRVRQLRENFDSGCEVRLSEENCPHDVATLLKEFLRDLPEPLLTRQLYSAFVQTQKIRNRQSQLTALRHLIQLLPAVNRDTLHALLALLSDVAAKAADYRGIDGQVVAGNKMDSNNLATLFAPNILHAIQPGSSPEKLAQDFMERADERIDVINVVRSMIENHKQLFEVSAELLNEVYTAMMDSNPEALEILLQRKCPTNLLTDDMESSSSVFEGSECSSVPRTPTYDLSTFSADSFLSLNYPREETLHEVYTLDSRFPSTRDRHFFESRREKGLERHLVVHPGTSDPRHTPIAPNENPAVITASLRISVAAKSPTDTKSFTVEDESDIPFIEDSLLHDELPDPARNGKPRERASVSSVNDSFKAEEITSARQRAKSSDSYLGSMRTCYRAPRTVAKPNEQTKSDSRDSVLSGVSFTSSPPETPISPAFTTKQDFPAGSGFVSGTSSPLSYGYSSPPLNSPPPSPTVLVHSSKKGDPGSTGVVRSKTVHLEQMIDTRDAPQDSGKASTAPTRSGRVNEAARGEPERVGVHDSAAGRGKMTAVLRKKWEVLASTPQNVGKLK